MKLYIWIGIAFCLSQSAMFSGLNLAFFSVSKLRLEIEAKNNNRNALLVARWREQSNLLLTTILWGNVGINVILTLLSNSVMTGVMAFAFSTVLITFLGEIIPQAYFARHALRMAALLSPLLYVYKLLLYPVTKPCSWLLDRWLGPEAIAYFREKDMREMLEMHIHAAETDIERVEGAGAMNFLELDDLRLAEEGEILDPRSIIQLPFVSNRPVFPEISETFLSQIHASGRKWVILVDDGNEPKLALDADGFLRDAMLEPGNTHPLAFCHRPIIVKDPDTRLGDGIARLKVHPEHREDDVVDDDLVLCWGEEKRIITGADVLGRLLRGITKHESTAFRRMETYSDK